PVDLRGRHGDRAPTVVSRCAHLAPRPALYVRQCRHHAAAGEATDPRLCRLVLAPIDRTRRTARLRPDRRTLRRGDDLWRAATGARSVPRDVRQAWHHTWPPDVQLLHPLR